VETQFSAKIKKLKTDNGDEYVNKAMTAFLELKAIIHDLSPPYAHDRNGLPEPMNRTIVTIIRLITLDCADVIPHTLCGEACSTAEHIKNCLPHSAFKLKTSPYEIIFADKPSIKHLSCCGAKYNVHVPEEKQIGTSKLSLAD
jgi:hypothetical protein